MLDLVPTDAEDRLVGHLGPDILAPGWDPAPVAAAVAAGPERTIGEALLDQRVLAGIGTFYLAEACFLRGVSPWTPAREVDVEPLLRMAHRLMSANVERAVQVTTGDARRGEEQWVHARSGRPCRRCGQTVRVASLGPAPQQRVVFYCPHCQRGPVPTDDGRPQAPLGFPGKPPVRPR
jgi:endonuclease-8